MRHTPLFRPLAAALTLLVSIFIADRALPPDPPEPLAVGERFGSAVEGMSHEVVELTPAGPRLRTRLEPGAAGPPLALFCLGATLPKPEGWKTMGGVAAASALKLLVMPALVALLAHLAGVQGIDFAVVVLAAAMPTGANAFLLARRFHTMMEASASTVVASTALSLLTLTALLSWLK